MSDKKPLILLTNDDGIHSNGLTAIHQKLKEIADVVVAAPLTEQSAVGHAITVSGPLRVIEVKTPLNDTIYGIKGTPADCVKLAVRGLLKKKPDAVISGINVGENTALNVLYSGTVSAATEGTILGIPSAALSLATYDMYDDFSFAAEIGQKIALTLLKNHIPSETLLNVNVPSVPRDQIKGIKVTRQGVSRFKEFYEKKVDPRRRIYYWLKGEMIEHNEQGAITDYTAVRENYVSVTPIQFQLTDINFINDLNNWNLSI